MKSKIEKEDLHYTNYLIHISLNETGHKRAFWLGSCTVTSFIPQISKGANIKNRYNQVPLLTQDTNRKMTNSQLDTTYESQEVSPFPAGDHKAHVNRLAQRHSKHKTEKNKRSTHLVEMRNVGFQMSQ